MMKEQRIRSKRHEASTPANQVRVLLVDDSPANLILLKAILIKLGFEARNIQNATNGKSAIEMIDAVFQSGDDYDMIITDLEMPVMNGLEMTRKLREQEDKLARKKSKTETERRPILFSSAAANSETEEFLIKCGRAGMSGFFPKPYNLNRIEKLLAAFFILPDFESTAKSL